MVGKQIANPQALYGLAWDESDQEYAYYFNASGRNMYTGDAVCLVQGGNSIVAALTLGGNPQGTPTAILANTAAGAAVLIPGVSFTTVVKDPACVGVAGVKTAGYIDSIPGGNIGTVGNSADVTIAGALPVGTITGPETFNTFPAMAIVPVIKHGPARVNVSNQTTAVGSLLCTTAAAVEGSGVLSATPATLGNLVAIALEVNSHAGTGYQSGSGAETVITAVVGIAGTTNASATTIAIPLITATSGFPTTGMVQFNDTGVLRIAGYTGITVGTGLTGVSATAIQTGIVAGTSVFLVQETIRALVKLG